MIKTRIIRFSKRSISMLLALLMMFSILMVGTISANAAISVAGYIYFAKPSDWTKGVNLMIGHNTYSVGNLMTKIEGTNLYYINISSSWTDSTEYAFIDDGNKWGGENKPIKDRYSWASHHSEINNWYAMNVGSTYFIADTNNNPEYYSSGYSAFNKTLTVKTMIYNYNNSSYSVTDTKYGSFSATNAKKLSAQGQSATSNMSQTNGTGTLTTARTNTATISQTVETGYTFMGWNDSGNTTGSSLSTGNYSFTNTGSAKTIYAYYKPKQSTVTLDQQGGSGGTSSIKATYGKAMPSATMPSRTGYTFGGYYDAVSGGTQYYTAAGASARTWNKTSSTSTLYAHWTSKKSALTFDYTTNGGSNTGRPTGLSATYGSDMPSISGKLPADRVGYTFTGIYDAASGGTKYYNADGSSARTWDKNTTSATTLYAQWTAINYSITATPGTGTTSDMYSFTGTTTAHYKTQATFTVTPTNGYEIVSVVVKDSGNNTISTTESDGTYTIAAANMPASNLTVTVTAQRLRIPTLSVEYTGVSGSATATTGETATTTTRHSVTLKYVNPDVFAGGTSYTITCTKDGAAQPSYTGTTGSAEITVFSKTLDAGTYVYTITCNGQSTSVTVVVNTAYTITVPAAKTNSSINANISNSYYYSAFTGEKTVVSAAGTYYSLNSKDYKVQYAVSNGTLYTFYSTGSAGSTSTRSGTVSGADVTLTAPTVYERQYTLTMNQSLNGGAATAYSTPSYKVKPVTGTNISAPTVTYYTLSNYTVTSGSVTVNGTSYATNATIPAGDLSAVKATANATIRANFTENSYTLTVERWKAGAGSRTNYTSKAVKPITTSTVAPGSISGYAISYWKVSSGTVYINGTAYTSSSGNINTAGSLSNVTIRGTATIRAYFTENTYTVNVQSESQGTKALGNVSPTSVTAGIDTKPTITATAKTGYEFVKWTGSNLTFTNANASSTTVAASASGTATANFKATVIYLDTSASLDGGKKWSSDSAVIKAVFGSSYLKMSPVDGVDDMWQIAIPSGFTLGTDKIKFQRCDSSGQTEWNITGETPTAAKQNQYKITTWGTAAIQDTPYFPPKTYNVTVETSTGGSVASESTTIPDTEGAAKALPTPTADYGYKFAGWEVISGSIVYNGTTYTPSSENPVFSTTASTSIQANMDSEVRANFTYNDSLNLYIVGRFAIWNEDHTSRTYTNSGNGNWSGDSTNIPFTYNPANHYYYVNTYSTIAEVSQKLSNEHQYFHLYDGSNSFYPTNGVGIDESNEKTHYDFSGTNDTNNLWFDDTINTNGPVTIWFDATTKELWFTIPARHTAEVSTITTKVRNNTYTTGTPSGGTVTVNGAASATVSEGTNYSIVATPKSGYKLTALAVNGTSILTSSNSTSAVTVSRAMAEGNDSYKEQITATFEAIQYTVGVGSNSTNNSNVVKFKVNDGSPVTSDSTVTVEDEITPVITVDGSDGYIIDSVKLIRTGAEGLLHTFTNSGTNTSPTYDSAQMKSYNATVYANFAAATPTITASDLPSDSNPIYAGQPITTGATTNRWSGTSITNYAMSAGSPSSSNEDGKILAPTDGIDINSGTNFTMTITATNDKSSTLSSGSNVVSAEKDITVHVKYTDLQKAYLNLKELYDEYLLYEISESDTVSGFSAFDTAMKEANRLLTGLPAWNDDGETSKYDAPRTNLQNAYDAIVFKTNTIYALVQYDTGIKVNAVAGTYSKWFTDRNTTDRVNGSETNFYMTKEGETTYTNNGNTTIKYLYSFTYYGKADLYIYRNTSGTITSGNKLSDKISQQSAYGKYYVDLKTKGVANRTGTVTPNVFTDFAMADNSATREQAGNDILEKSEYTLSEMINFLGITYSGSLKDSSQDINQTFTITGPRDRSDVSSTSSVLTSSQPWTPEYEGRYTFVLNSNIGIDSRNNLGATFSQTASYTLYVAYENITVYADMNGNVGTPILSFNYTYNDEKGQQVTGTLPYEFDLETGSESVYSVVLSLPVLKEYGYTNISTTGIKVDKLYIDTDEYKGFTIEKQALRTGTVWLKANSTHMTGFNQIAYGSANRSFKAVFRDSSNNDTPVTNPFAVASGTGVITDELLNNGTDDYYNYNVFYAANDGVSTFSYNVKVEAENDLTHTVGGTTTHYYFDHWEDINRETETISNIVSGTDININLMPEDEDVTYVAVYKPVDTSKRVEITYKFEDYDTDDGNYVYDPDKKTKAEEYVKTFKVAEAVTDSNASSIASKNAPIIKSNYFDYTFDSATYKEYDPTTNKYKVEAKFSKTPHTYKIKVVKPDGSVDIKTGNYQNKLELIASEYGIAENDKKYHWYTYEGEVKDSNKRVLKVGENFTARFVTSNDVNTGVQTFYLKAETATVTTGVSSAITYSYTSTYYSGSTERVRHNFYIIDTTAKGTLVGGGVLYATAENGNYRKDAAKSILDTTEHMTTYIKGILGENFEKSDKEYTPQTINNVGFRYLPYEKGKDVFRYSDAMGAYVYTFAGDNNNSSLLAGQTLRVFSYFIYKDASGKKSVVVSSMYAECSRYVDNNPSGGSV